MQHSQQTTIARAVEWRGIGLHGGRPAAVRVLPASEDTGLVFVVPEPGGRGEVRIPAHPDCVHASERATTLASRADPRARVATVEHLLAALFGLGMAAARIEVSGGATPAPAGRAAPFAEGLRRAGLRALAAPRRRITIAPPLALGAGDRRIRIEPAEHLAIDYAIDFAHPFVGRQRLVLDRVDAGVFERELEFARTFAFEDEVEHLRAAGLARGGDLSNTLVIGAYGLVNPDGNVRPGEFVRHKIVDLLGDLALLGAEPRGRIFVERGGHALHHALVRAVATAGGIDAGAQDGARAASQGR